MNDSLLISPEWLAERLENGRPTTAKLLLVDTRARAEFDKGHIPGAINLPSGDLYDATTESSDLLPKEAVERRMSEAGIENDAHLVFYDASGLVPSARVFWALENFGRGNMSLLDGGFLGWFARRLPTETSGTTGNRKTEGSAAGASPTAHFDAGSEGLAMATRDDVLAAIDDADTIIIDTRTEDEYFGRTGAHRRNGHIPGAKNVDWQRHIADLFDPTLKPAAELRALYEEIGLDESKRAIVYCRTGSRSSHTYFVLRYLGYPDVRNYKRSWTEWNVDESLPIE